jgi:hypothetical protein
MGRLRQREIRWQDLPRERQRRLTVLVGKLVRQRLAAVIDPEKAHERNDVAGCPAAHGQDPSPAP